MTAIYNCYGYVKEIRAGLEAWARELTVPRVYSPGPTAGVGRIAGRRLLGHTVAQCGDASAYVMEMRCVLETTSRDDAVGA